MSDARRLSNGFALAGMPGPNLGEAVLRPSIRTTTAEDKSDQKVSMPAEWFRFSSNEAVKKGRERRNAGRCVGECMLGWMSKCRAVLVT